MERAPGELSMLGSDGILTERPRLRIVTFDGDVREAAGDGELTPDATLSQLFQRYGLLCLAERDAAPLNVKQYRQGVRYWATATGDPPLRRIGQQTVQNFRDWLERLPGRGGRTIARNTVRKHLTTIKAILRWAGPRGPGGDAYCKRGLFGRDRDGDWRQPPRIKLPPIEEKTPDPFSLEDIGRWVRGCDVATAPTIAGVTPCAWWRSLVIFSYNTGIRIGTTIAIEWSMVRGNWLVIPARLVKGRRRELRIWFNASARRAAEAVRTDDPRIFAWPNKIGWLMVTQKRIIDASEIPDDESYDGTHRLRKALATWLTARNPAVARMQLGHALTGDVLLAHYADPAIVEELMEQVPQPDCNWPPETRRNDRQMLLF